MSEWSVVKGMASLCNAVACFQGMAEGAKERAMKKTTKKELIAALLWERAEVEALRKANGAEAGARQAVAHERDAAQRKSQDRSLEILRLSVALEGFKAELATSSNKHALLLARFSVVVAERDLARAQLAERKERERVRHERKRPS